MRILVVEDDENLNRQLAEALKEAGYVVDQAHDGLEGHYLGDAEPYDAVILDIGLPEMDGITVLEKWRADGKRMPVLLLTARDRWSDKVAGIDAGADDYVAKPFALAELTARLRALLRRGAPRESVLRVADLEMDTIKRLVRRAGRLIDLKPKEYALLEFLMRHSDRPLTKSLIIEHVWDIHFDSISNVVEVHINSLRNKVDRGFTPPLIHTIRGVGYVLKVE